MKNTFNLEERKPIWIALSDFYLDTELQAFTVRHIAFTILESPYSLDEVKAINKYEVFPVLQSNLLSVAGEWAGFDEDWLVKRILTSLTKRNAVNNWLLERSYSAHQWMVAAAWEKLESEYVTLKNNPGSYLVSRWEL